MVDFSREVLTQVINKRRPVATPIRDAHFSGPAQLHSSSLITVDIVNGPEGLAKVISSGARSLRAPTDSWSELSLKIPRYSEHDVIKPGDYNGRRMPGTDVAVMSAGIMQLYVQKLDRIRERFDRTVEYMCIKGMQGSVEDGYGNVIATYNVPASTPVVFAPDSGGDDPREVFVEEVTVGITRALGGAGGQFIAHCGTSAYLALYKQHQVQALLKSANGGNLVSIAADGTTMTIAGIPVQFRLAPETYIDMNGNHQVFVPDNKIIIASTAMGGEMHYGPCEAPEMQLLMQEWFADAWDERDPPTTFVRVETNPLPLVRRPDTVFSLTVSTS